MRRVIEFSSIESFTSEQSTSLAKLLLNCPAHVRETFRKACDITIRLDSDPIRVAHSGRTIGIGSFNSKDGLRVSVVISPKIEALRLRVLLRALGYDSQWHAPISFYNEQGEISADPAIEGDENFSPSRLYGLLEDIALFVRRLHGEIHFRRRFVSKNRIIGSVLLQETLTSFLMGRPEFHSTASIEGGLRRYKILLLATASSVAESLIDWSLLPSDTAAIKARVAQIATALAVTGTEEFRMGWPAELCRPPFPFGFKDILRKCFLYWRWLDKFKIQESSSEWASYKAMSVSLDDLFKQYVGVAWGRSLPRNYKPVKRTRYDFEIRRQSTESQRRQVDPDHLFVDEVAQRLLIIDAKYRSSDAEREDLFQVLSYSAFRFPAYRDYLKTAVLTYPGPVEQISEVLGFTNRVFLVELPICERPEFARLKRFVDEL